MIILSLAALPYLAISLWHTLMLQLTAPMRTDAREYMTVGRAILNGFTLYRDMLDGRPPGMGLLFALSIFISGDERFMQFLQAIVIAGIPCMSMVLAYRILKEERKTLQSTGILLGLVYGTLFALYTADHSGTIQTESYGAFFVIAYLLVLCWDSHSFSWLRVGLASICMMCSYGLKEPFVLVLAASALLIIRNQQDFKRKFLLPLCISLAMGAVIMAILGWLVPYFTIDLRETLLHRIQGEIPDWVRTFPYHGYIPFPARGLLIPILFTYAAGYFSGISMAMICTLFTIPIVRAKQNEKMAVFQWLCWLSGGIFFLSLAAYTVMEAYELRIIQQTDYTSTLPYVLSSVIFGLYCLLQTIWQIKTIPFRKVAAELLLVFTVLYLTALVVAMGVYYYFNHFVFAVPVYIAIFCVFVTTLKEKDILTRNLALAASFFIVLSGLFPPQEDFRIAATRQHYLANNRIAEQQLANKGDAMLWNCKITQFLTLGSQPSYFYSRTQHSPLGPDFNQSWSTGTKFNSIWLREAFIHNIDTASVIIDMPEIFRTLPQKTSQRIQHQYTQTVPPCAAAYLPLEGLTVLFRKSPL
ncbi:MAG: hypothetical protein JWM56_339 [Candidatus Peribacteria bacterium]|nr:hypothetical protein [Candidatus Peribacteria bacterium]